MAFKEKEEKELQELSPGRLQNPGTGKREEQDGRLTSRGWQGRTKTPRVIPEPTRTQPFWRAGGVTCAGAARTLRKTRRWRVSAGGRNRNGDGDEGPRSDSPFLQARGGETATPRFGSLGGCSLRRGLFSWRTRKWGEFSEKKLRM